MTHPFALDGRVAVVTGAAGLLGRHHAAALARVGAQVVVTDLEEGPCHELAGQLSREHGTECLARAADITDPRSVKSLGDAVLARFGRIDALVNNAALNEKVEGKTPSFPFEEYPLDLWERALRVNVTGAFLCCQVLGSAMARQGRGSIVNVASTYALVGPDPSLYRGEDGRQTFWKSAAYPTTKAALLGLTRFLAAYWGGAGVRVNALLPGGVENGQGTAFVERYARKTPLGRMATASDYAGAIVFLASDASAYMTGAHLVVDGGFTAW